VKFSTGYNPRENNKRTQTSRDALQSIRFSTNYDPRDNNIRTQTSLDGLQSVRFSTSYDPRDNNGITKDRQYQERQAVNASTRGERGNNLGSRILNFFARRKNNLRYIDVKKCDLFFIIIIYDDYYLSY
jgi:hypothetical protein